MDQLNALSKKNEADVVSTSMEYYQYIVIRLGEEQFGIDIQFVENIVRMQNVTRIPKVPAYLKGVINLRGEVIPVVSIRLKMGLPADEIGRSSRIIILKTEQEGNLGIIVDEVREVVTLSSDNIEKVTHNAQKDDSSFINGIGKNGEELISLLDLNAITLDDNA